jgi:hypothetical protein
MRVSVGGIESGRLIYVVETKRSGAWDTGPLRRRLGQYSRRGNCGGGPSGCSGINQSRREVNGRAKQEYRYIVLHCKMGYERSKIGNVQTNQIWERHVLSLKVGTTSDPRHH